MMTNSFTVDLEDWYQGTEKIAMDQSSRFEDRIEYSTNKLLDLLDEFNTRATFFVLGHIAEKKQSLVKKVFDRGHEIGSHGYSHELVYNQTPQKFREELRKSKQVLENIIGEKISGHRASNWTVTEKSLWALNIIKEEGFLYDSSIFPTKNYLFGIPDAPRFLNVLPNGLTEIPPSTLKVGSKTLPFSGGFFLRALPAPLVQWGVRQLNQQGESAVLYIHPWEIDAEQPRNLPVPFKNKLIHYFGLKTTEAKLRSLFKAFKFDRMDKVFASQLRKVA